MDVEDFLRDNIAIKEHTSEGDPVDDFRWFIGSDFQTPESEEDNNRIDNHREIRKWYAQYHRVWMHDNIGTRECCIDIATT